MPIPGGSRATRKLSFVGRISNTHLFSCFPDEMPTFGQLGVLRRFQALRTDRFRMALSGSWGS
jgi:hypothetical protein